MEFAGADGKGVEGVGDLLRVNYGDALKSHSGFVGDHFVEGHFNFDTIRHSVLVSAPHSGALTCQPSLRIVSTVKAAAPWKHQRTFSKRQEHVSVGPPL
jgi:hypothetical protein